MFLLFSLSFVVGLARSEALRSPEGGAFRAKRRARPTTRAPRRALRRALVSRRRGGPPAATGDGRAAPTFASSRARPARCSSRASRSTPAPRATSAYCARRPAALRRWNALCASTRSRGGHRCAAPALLPNQRSTPQARMLGFGCGRCSALATQAPSQPDQNAAGPGLRQIRDERQNVLGRSAPAVHQNHDRSRAVERLAGRQDGLTLMRAWA